MAYCNINGAESFYTIYPVEQPHASIVFVHGSGGDNGCWHLQMNALAKQGIATVALDLPGHGQSQGPACKSIGQSASFVLDFVSSLNLPGPLYLAGHSMGAAIVLHISRYHPESLAGIILVGGGCRMKVLPSFLEGLARGEFDPNFLRNAFGPGAEPQLVDEHLAQAAKISTALLFDDFNACNNFDMRNEVAVVDKPTLIIVGEKDLLTPVKYSQFLHQQLPASRLEIIADAGHYVMMEQPAQVNRAIAEFIL